MRNRILHSWSLLMKFMKLAKGLFNKFYMTMSARSSISVSFLGHEITFFRHLQEKSGDLQDNFGINFLVQTQSIFGTLT